MKITFLYCEGPHDLAFLSKLIDSLNITNHAIDKVSDLPDIIQNIIKSAILKIEADSIRIDKPLRAFFPNKVFSLCDEHYICVYATGGKESLQAALENIRVSKALIGREKLTKVSLIRHAFVLDADYKKLDDGSDNIRGGLINTLSYLSESIKSIVTDFVAFDANSQWRETSFGTIGNFIFTDSSNIEGTVEDLVQLFLKHETLLHPSNIFRDGVVAFDVQRRAKVKDRTKLQKIVLTSMTQAFHPGASLAVGLSNDKIIDSQTLRDHEVSQQFSAFINIT